jgi:hypothetical protein
MLREVCSFIYVMYTCYGTYVHLSTLCITDYSSVICSTCTHTTGRMSIYLRYVHMLRDVCSFIYVMYTCYGTYVHLSTLCTHATGRMSIYLRYVHMLRDVYPFIYVMYTCYGTYVHLSTLCTHATP